jgi:cytochrome b pre-mRNA-processing protein 3
MLHLFFNRTRRADRLLANKLYEQIVASARRAEFFVEMAIPDTPLGRFEVLSVHMILFLRCARGVKELEAVAQQITDEFFLDIDHALRELGIGDVGVPKLMKKLARMFYGRVASYGQALDSGDNLALRDALVRNIMPDTSGWAGGDLLCAYVRDAASHLASLPHDEIVKGALSFPPLSKTPVKNQ